MQKPIVTYPCEFPIKIIGLANDVLEGIVIQILNQHVSDLGEGAIRSTLSKNNKYVSITATIHAQSQEHLDDLYRALSSNPHVLVAL